MKGKPPFSCDYRRLDLLYRQVASAPLAPSHPPPANHPPAHPPARPPTRPPARPYGRLVLPAPGPYRL